MKRALLYFFFLGLFFSNSEAHAKAFSQSAVVKSVVHKIQNKKGSFSHKADVVNDYDDDIDDDIDDCSTSVKGRIFFLTTTNNNLLPVNFISKTFCDKIYRHVNFSRLPRFNYISLRVLRI